jgi:hypothetical protein
MMDQIQKNNNQGIKIQKTKGLKKKHYRILLQSILFSLKYYNNFTINFRFFFFN